MNHTEQSNEAANYPATTPVGVSHDDISMLNQVLQQVKGISCVSCPTCECQVVEQATEQA